MSETHALTVRQRVERLSHYDLLTYVEKGSWAQAVDVIEGAVLFESVRFNTVDGTHIRQVLVPTNPDDPGYVSMMVDVVRRLADVEGRSSEAVLADVERNTATRMAGAAAVLKDLIDRVGIEEATRRLRASLAREENDA